MLKVKPPENCKSEMTNEMRVMNGHTHSNFDIVHLKLSAHGCFIVLFRSIWSKSKNSKKLFYDQYRLISFQIGSINQFRSINLFSDYAHPVLKRNLPSPRASMYSSSERQSCNQPIDFDGNAPFPDIVLVINFNHPFYDNLLTLIKYYKPLFPNYIICGPEVDKKGNLIVVIEQVGEYGAFGTQCVVEAIRRRPGYAGYF